MLQALSISEFWKREANLLYLLFLLVVSNKGINLCLSESRTVNWNLSWRMSVAEKLPTSNYIINHLPTWKITVELARSRGRDSLYIYLAKQT